MQLTGMRELQNALKRSPEETTARVGDAIAASTFAIAQRMRASAPEKTGTLRRAITSTTKRTSGSVIIEPAGYYWRFLEYGTVNISVARPFVRPAAEAETGPFEDRMKAIAQGLERDFSSGRFL